MKKHSFLKRLYFVFWLFVMQTKVVSAYIDPSVVTYAIQAVAGIAISLGTFFSIYWRRIKKNIHINETNKTYESDDLFYNDPATGKTIKPNVVDHHNDAPTINSTPDNSATTNIYPGLILAFSASFLISVFGPLDYYFHNVYSFTFDLFGYLPELFKLFFLLFGILSLVLFLSYKINKPLYRFVFCAGFIIYFATYIQGNYLVKNLPVMDGTQVDWTQFKTDSIHSILLWILTVVFVLIIMRLFQKEKGIRILSSLSALITSALVVTLFVIGIQNNGFVKKSIIIPTKQDEFTMSTDENFIILVLDMYDSYTFNEMLSEPNNDYTELLSDFTYYPDTVSAYGYTMHAIPHMLTGQWYENEGNFNDYIASSMKESELFSDLENNKYQMSLYEPYLNYDFSYLDRFTNFKSTTYEFYNFREFAVRSLKLVWYRYAPFQLKKYANIQASDLNEIRKNGDSDFNYNNYSFYDDIKSSVVETTDQKIFKFIHIQGAHMPYIYDEQMNDIPASEGTYTKNQKAAMVIVKDYLDTLKRSDTYNNSNIIILSDHGYQVDREPYYLARCNPLLLVKLKDESHEFAINNAPISYEDLMGAYHRIISGCSPDEVFPVKEGDQRTRRILAYQGPGGYRMIEEYFQTGKAWDCTTMKKGDTFEADPNCY